jgi:NCS2 family nucleobase:cation symporter-2
MKKPAHIIYGLNDTPPLHVTALNGFQYVSLIAIYLIYPLLVFRESGTPIETVVNLMAVAMLVLGAGTFLQALRLRGIGSGYMCPATFTITYLGPSLLAANIGGLPLVCGMTVFAGLLEMCLAPLLNRLRSIFPPEISGLVIFMIGLSGGIAGLRAIFGERAAPVSEAEWWVGGLTLAVMIGLNVWGKGIVRMLCAMIGLAAGYVAALSAGLISAREISALGDASWIGMPVLGLPALSFDASLVLPFAIASVAATMKAVGTLTVCQRMSDADWVRPEMKSISRGVMADGATTALAGLAGVSGMNTSTPAVGLAAATGMASRRVAYATAIIFVLLGFFPKLPALLAVMPRPMIVAALLFSACFILVNGLQVMSSRMLDARRTLVIALSIIAGAAVEVFPLLATTVPSGFAPVIGSSLVFSTVVALGLNLLFRLGMTRTTTLAVPVGAFDPARLEEFMETSGAAWGARRDVIDKARFNLAQSVETILEGCDPQGPLEIQATFDEFSLDLRVRYLGPPLEIPERRPSNEEIMESEDAHRRLAGFMLRRNADRVSASHRAGQSTVLFHFDH